MSKLTTFLFLAVFLIGGCEILGTKGPDQVEFKSDQVELSTDKDQYETGETIRVRLVNSSESELRMGACVNSIDGYVAGTWSTSYEPGYCTMQLITLGPSESFTFSVGTKQLLPADKYRVTKSVETDDKSHTIVSNTFTFAQ